MHGRKASQKRRFFSDNVQKDSFIRIRYISKEVYRVFAFVATKAVLRISQ